MTKEIPLTHGNVAVVDDADYPALSVFQWRAIYNHKSDKWYAFRWICSNNTTHRLYMHRAILGLDFGDRREVDHRNDDGLRNTRDNLRVCNQSQNQANRRPNRNSTSGFRGVTRSRGSWIARIGSGSSARYLGAFATPEDAARAYDRAARDLFGEFARPNFPNG